VAGTHDLLFRLQFIDGGLRAVLVEAAGLANGLGTAVIEDGVYRTMPKVCAMLGEVRGLAMSACWAVGWRVVKMAPVTWKSMLTKEERAMKKDSNYVALWNRRMGLNCRTPDVVDAVLIATRYVRGRR
jgi:Holliday junction resolvasome RuvABC endonuclease subunit